MKKRLFAVVFFIFTLLFLGNQVSAETVSANSKISSVTVFPDSALITRVATVELGAGEGQVIFKDIIPQLDENSLKVSGLGNADFKILGAQVKKEFLEEASAEKVKQIESDIQNVLDELKKLDDADEIISKEKDFLDSLIQFSKEQLPKDLVSKVPARKDLEEVLGFLDVSLTQKYGAAQAIEIKRRDLQKKLDVLRRQLAELGTSRKLRTSITVDVLAPKSGSLTLSVSYLVYGASWLPVYEARTIFEKSQVELILYGIVSQRTGEGWTDVEVTLSTAKPSVSGRMPDIYSWVLRPYEVKSDVMMSFSSRKVKAMRVAVDEDSEQFRSGMEGEAKYLKEEMVPAAMAFATSEQKGVSVVYKIPRKATIKSDGSQQRLPIAAESLVSKFKYLAYPRAAMFGYLTSRVVNLPEMQLLPGRVNIFLEGDFVGASAISGIGPGEEFDLYLGADENVKVKKQEVEKKVDDVLLGGIPSPTRKVTYKYKLTVENYKPKKIDFELFDSLPVSEDERIKVRIDNVSLEPKEKDYKDKKGIWRWELSLEPKAKKEIAYTVTIEHPRGMRVEGL